MVWLNLSFRDCFFSKSGKLKTVGCCSKIFEGPIQQKLTRDNIR
jgi:hypothetical protein